MIEAMNVRDKMPFPTKAVPTCIVSQRLLKMGLTVMSTPGMVEEIIIIHAARGTMKEPSTMSLNFKWKIR